MDDERIECSIDSLNEKHFIVKPLRLNCGHFICLNCAITTVNQHVRCNKCESINLINTDFESNDEVNELRKVLENNFKQIFDSFINKFNSLFQTLDERKESFTSKVDYLIQEIDVRVESVKIELEKHADDIKLKLEMIKQQVDKRIDMDQLKRFKETVDNYSESTADENDKFLESVQEKISNLKTMITILDEKLTLQISDSKLDSDIIALCGNERTYKAISNFPLVKFWPVQGRDFTEQSHYSDICALQNGYCLMSQLIFMVLMDENMHSIQTKYSEEFDLNINGVERPDPCFFGCVVSDNESNIFACDWSNMCVLKLNLQLELVGYVEINEPNDDPSNCPIAICNDGECNYVACSVTNHVKKYNKNLELVTFYDFYDLKIGSISVLGEIMCCASEEKILFYDLKTLRRASWHNGRGCNISNINGKFCVTIPKAKFSFFNSKTFELENEMDIESKMTNEQREITKLVEFKGKYLLNGYNYDGFDLVNFTFLI